jgi:hypothetical protein
MQDEPNSTPPTWCAGGGTIGRLHRPITEAWLIAHEFRIESGRQDPRLPVRSLSVAPKAFMTSSDDLCIDVAPSHDGEWHCWVAQREPYQFIHVRMMRETWEIAALYEGLTGKIWPGSY